MYKRQSNWCGAGGWRLGFLAVPKKLTEFLKSLKSLASESYSTVNSPSQFAAVEAYKGNYESYRLKVRAILNAVGKYVYNNLKSNKVLINQPQGGIIAIGVIRKVPSVIETDKGDFIGIRKKIILSHSYDHRIINGSVGSSFVKRVAEYLEKWDITQTI